MNMIFTISPRMNLRRQVHPDIEFQNEMKTQLHNRDINFDAGDVAVGGSRTIFSNFISRVSDENNSRCSGCSGYR